MHCVVDESSAGNSRGIAIKGHGGPIWRIHESRPRYDPIAYVLLLPRGEIGRRYDIPRSMGRKKTTPKEYATYRLMIRGDELDGIHRLGKLFHQYMCDQWSKVGNQRLHYIRRNQQAIRAAAYLQVHVRPPGANRGCDLGKNAILPAKFTGARGICGSFTKTRWLSFVL